MKQLIALLSGIATFLLIVIFVDGALASWIFHLLGGVDGGNLAILIKIAIWAVLLSVTGGVAIILGMIVGVIVAAILEVI